MPIPVTKPKNQTTCKLCYISRTFFTTSVRRLFKISLSLCFFYNLDICHPWKDNNVLTRVQFTGFCEHDFVMMASLVGLARFKRLT